MKVIDIKSSATATGLSKSGLGLWHHHFDGEPLIFKFNNLYKLPMVIPWTAEKFIKEVRVNSRIVNFLAAVWLTFLVNALIDNAVAENLIEPSRSDDGLYHHQWFKESSLDLKEDLHEADEAGKRLAIIFEQVGCIYCTKMHTEFLAQKSINDYVRKNFDVV